MKKIIFTIISIFLFAGLSQAQSDSFKNFRVDAGLFFASPAGDHLDAGIGYYLNPKYAINDNILIGAKLESAILASADENGFDVSSVISYAATFDYYFNTNKFRPFVGADAGIYSLGNLEVKDNGTNNSFADAKIELGTKLGFAPKVGFSWGHFDMAFQYNFVLGSDDDSMIKPSDYNYASFKLGFHFGGGRR